MERVRGSGTTNVNQKNTSYYGLLTRVSITIVEGTFSITVYVAIILRVPVDFVLPDPIRYTLPFRNYYVTEDIKITTT